MDESNEREDLCNKDENEVILLPWYPNPRQISRSVEEIDHGYEDEEEEMNVVGDGKPIVLPWYPSQMNFGDEEFDCSNAGEASTSASTSARSCPKLIAPFVSMTFPEETVRSVLKENGKDDSDLIMEYLSLTYSALNQSSPQHENEYDDFSDLDSCLYEEEVVGHQSDKERKLLHLIDMGFLVEEASSAIEASGPESSIDELMDFIYAAQTSKFVDAPPEVPAQSTSDFYEIGLSDYNEYTPTKKKVLSEGQSNSKRKMATQQSRRFTTIWQKKITEGELEEDYIEIPKPTVGFGTPTHPLPTFQRMLPEAAIVDSKHFSAAARKRGYVHNLSIENKFLLRPLPPLPIQTALPLSKMWPSCDYSEKRAKTTQLLREILEKYDGNPPEDVRKEVLSECKKWNLVWTGKNKLAVLEPDEIESILGYLRDPTRGICRTDRYKSHGNSFEKMSSHTAWVAFFNPLFGFVFIGESRSAQRGQRSPFGLDRWDDKHQKYVVFGGFIVTIAGDAEPGLAILQLAKTEVLARNLSRVCDVAEVIHRRAKAYCADEKVRFENSFIVGSAHTNFAGTEFLDPYIVVISENKCELAVIASIGSGSLAANTILSAYPDWATIQDEEEILTRLVMSLANAVGLEITCGGPVEYIIGRLNSKKVEIKHNLIMAEDYLTERNIWRGPDCRSVVGEFSPVPYSDPWEVLLNRRHLIRNMRIDYGQLFERNVFYP